MRSWFKAAPVLLVLVLGACNTAPVYNVEIASFNTREQLTLNQATDAIMAAGAELGWSMTEIAPGEIRGVLKIRSHEAVVDVKYDELDYSIVYADSTNLKYGEGEIHKRYNSWVQQLERLIRQKAQAAA